MDKKSLAVYLSAFIVALYFAIVMVVFFGILHIETVSNCAAGLIFEFIGFILLVWLVLTNIVSKPIKTGFLIPLITVTVIYTVILSVLNFWAIMIMPSVYFILVHLILLLVYCLITFPIYIMGRR